MKKRRIVRTNNLIGELGEFRVVIAYKNNQKLPTLELKQTSTTNIDATSVKGKRYAIKATSGSATGVFSSFPRDNDHKMFEYLVLVIFGKQYNLEGIYELTWSQFLLFRKIKQPERKWCVPITQELLSQAKKIS